MRERGGGRRGTLNDIIRTWAARYTGERYLQCGSAVEVVYRQCHVLYAIRQNAELAGVCHIDWVVWLENLGMGRWLKGGRGGTRIQRRYMSSPA